MALYYRRVFPLQFYALWLSIKCISNATIALAACRVHVCTCVIAGQGDGGARDQLSVPCRRVRLLHLLEERREGEWGGVARVA